MATTWSSPEWETGETCVAFACLQGSPVPHCVTLYAPLPHPSTLDYPGNPISHISNIESPTRGGALASVGREGTPHRRDPALGEME